MSYKYKGVVMTEQEKQPVIQSNDLVNAHYQLDLVEQKLLRFLISMIRPADDKFEKNYYKVEISELLDYLGWEKTGKIYKDIRESAKYLMTRPIKIIKPDETIETTWIASFRYPKNMGWIEFEFSSRLESELLKLKDQFTKYNDECITSFLKGDIKPLFKSLKKLSGLLLENFTPMIPDSFHGLWQKGIESNAYYLKLCGSGGGGFILGFTRDFDKANRILASHKPEVIYRF